MKTTLNILIVSDDEFCPLFLYVLIAGRFEQNELSGYTILVRRSYLNELSKLKIDRNNTIVIYQPQKNHPSSEVNKDILLLNSLFLSTSIIFCVTAYSHYLLNKLKAGNFAGYILSNDLPQEKVRVVDEILKGNIALSIKVMAQYLRHQQRKKARSYQEVK
ncbi:MAG: hypothetical protein NTW29_10640 [Bacteroidetes bacterium]|nr:hypothetical protein [Bacteroidota bacterium]